MLTKKLSICEILEGSMGNSSPSKFQFAVTYPVTEDIYYFLGAMMSVFMQ